MDDAQPSPWRINTIIYRRADDYVDILEAEFRRDVDQRLCVEDGEQKVSREPRYCYDESQSLEILAAEEVGWLYGEQLFMPKSPRFADKDLYVQDFGFGPYLDRRREVWWRSIAEEDSSLPTERSGSFAPGFFLSLVKKTMEILKGSVEVPK